MNRAQKFLRLLTPVGVFLLRGTGWTAVGVLVGFIVSNFFRLPGRVDTFALTETLLGVVITGLSIVAAFIVAFQWSYLDSKINAFDSHAKEAQETFTKLADEWTKMSQKFTEEVQTNINAYEKERTMFEDEVHALTASNSALTNKITENQKMMAQFGKALDVLKPLVEGQEDRHLP